MLVILFSFPYDIYITLYVTEFLIFSEMRYSELRKWLKNLTRAVVILLSLTVSTIFYDKLPQITGLVGILIGVPVVMITPALLNNNLYAKEDKCSRAVNYILIVYSVLAMVFLSIFIITHWSEWSH